MFPRASLQSYKLAHTVTSLEESLVSLKKNNPKTTTLFIWAVAAKDLLYLALADIFYLLSAWRRALAPNRNKECPPSPLSLRAAKWELHSSQEKIHLVVIDCNCVCCFPPSAGAMALRAGSGRGHWVRIIGKIQLLNSNLFIISLGKKGSTFAEHDCPDVPTSPETVCSPPLYFQSPWLNPAFPKSLPSSSSF